MDTLKQKDFSFTPESLRVRCPHCRKLYLVQRTDIRETRPRFECVQCRERFWLSIEEVDANQEMVGLPLQVRETPKPQRVEPCPKCRAPIHVGSMECTSCGVVVNKWKAARTNKDGTIVAGDILQRQWQKVMDAFTHGPTHMDFITACRRENNLAFAAQQYGILAKVLPGDEQIRQKVREIEALAIAELPPTEKKFRPRVPRLWQIPLIAGTAMMILGLAMPVFRNMVGVGAAFIFMSLAIRWQTNR